MHMQLRGRVINKGPFVSPGKRRSSPNVLQFTRSLHVRLYDVLVSARQQGGRAQRTAELIDRDPLRAHAFANMPVRARAAPCRVKKLPRHGGGKT